MLSGPNPLQLFFFYNKNDLPNYVTMVKEQEQTRVYDHISTDMSTYLLILTKTFRSTYMQWKNV